MMLIVAFMFLGHIYFGTIMGEFSTVDASFFQTFDYLVGGLDFFRLNEVGGLSRQLTRNNNSSEPGTLKTDVCRRMLSALIFSSTFSSSP